MMIVKVFWHYQWDTSQSHIKLINWRSHRTKEVSKGFEIGLSVKMFRHIDQTALWCSLFKSRVLLASRLMTESLEKVWTNSVLVWIEELNENEPLLKCRK
jgi:hypothetical protein